MSADENKLRNLMLRGLAGDGAAYQACLKELSVHLRAFFRKRLTKVPDEVEDLVQETLIAVHNQRHTWEPDQLLTPWIYAIARYKLVDMLRRYGGHEALHDSCDDQDELLTHSDQEALDARRDVAVLLAQLPERQRLPIQHMKLEGLSVAETAQLTGMSASAIKVGVHRGLKALAEKMRGNK